METAEKTKRLRERPLTLMKEALGGPAEARAKAERLLSMIVGYSRGDALDDRLQILHKKGRIEEIPNRVQLFVGAADMLRFWIEPAASEYYADKGIDFRFHQILRFLDEPASLADPIGFFSTKDGIIGHLMQVVHANPVYDLELLDSWDDGLDELELQLKQMIAGTHPRSASIGAIVEEPDYHARLLAFIRAFRKDPKTPPMLRSNVGGDPKWRDRERTFGSLWAAMRYCKRLPDTAAAGIAHLVQVRTFPAELAEPEA